MVATIMKGSVKALVDMGWEGLKLDSCSQFNNLSYGACFDSVSEVFWTITSVFLSALSSNARRVTCSAE